MSILVFCTNKERLLDHFSKDPILFAYHLGDLDDFFFEHCQFGVTYGYMPRIEEAILVYTGGTTPTVLAFGLSGNFPSLLSEMLELLPTTFYCHYQKESLPLFEQSYSPKFLGTHLKMKLDHFIPNENSTLTGNIRLLNKSDLEEIIGLFAASYPGNYFHERMLETKKYFGYFENRELLSLAGVHVYSKEYNIAVLGNITTHPKQRSRGLATHVTSRLITELLRDDLLIGLNVKQDNLSAINSYKQLGFTEVCQYEEALFTRKKS